MSEPVRVEFGDDGSFDVNQIGGYCYIGMDVGDAGHPAAIGIDLTRENKAKVYRLCRAVLDAAGLQDVRMVQEKSGEAHLTVQVETDRED